MSVVRVWLAVALVMSSVVVSPVWASEFSGEWHLQGEISPLLPVSFALRNSLGGLRATMHYENEAKCGVEGALKMSVQNRLLIAGCSIKGQQGVPPIFYGSIKDGQLEGIAIIGDQHIDWTAKKVTEVKDGACVGPFKRQKNCR